MNQEHNEEKLLTKKEKKVLLSSTVALLTATSVMVGALFDAPDNLLTDQDLNPKVVCIDGTGVDDDADEDAGQEDEDTEKSRRRIGVRAAMRARILQLPLFVRLLVILPMWFMGWAVSGAAGALWSVVLSPVLGHVLSTLLLLAALFCAFCLAAKAVFPDLPLKKIVNKRSMLTLIIGALALGAADAALPLVWEEYDKIANLVKAVGGLLITGGAVTAFSLREQRRRVKLASSPPDPGITEEDERIIHIMDAGDTITVKLPPA